MKNWIALGACLIVTTAASAADPLASGPQAGEKVPGPFKPLNVTGPDAGKEECLFCKGGAGPVAMVFVRELSPSVISLIKKLDAEAAAHPDSGFGCFVIVLSDDKNASQTVAEIAKKEKISTAILAVFAAGGPAKYKLSPDAEATILLYAKRTVKTNYAYRKGELTPEAVDKVITDLALILPKS